MEVVNLLRGGGRMAQFSTLLLVLLLFACVVTRSSAAAYSDQATSARFTRSGLAAYSDQANSAGAELSRFNLSLGAQFWNEKIMGRVFEDWKVSEGSAGGKEALQNFTKAGTIANYLNTRFVDALNIPLPINFIFIGFNGEGNQGFQLGEEELERWFSKIDNILEHTRVPQLGEALTPFYRTKGTGERQHHLPFVSYTHYNYSVHGIGLNARATAVFERAIKLLSRKDNFLDTGPEGPQWQVDIGGMSNVFRSLVTYLQLEQAYNVFVLNPKRDPSHGSYGYRSGLSKSEIGLVKGDAAKRASLLNSKERAQDFLADVEKTQNPLYERHPLLRFSWTAADEGHTATWTDTMNTALDSLEAALRLKSEEELTFWTARLILHGTDAQLSSALRKGLNLLEESGLQPECLVDTWVGGERWSFLDLTAGPFTWGPTVGGDGVRSELSIPSVDSSFAIADFNAGRDARAVQHEFQTLWRDKFSDLGDNERLTVEVLLAEIEVYKLFADMHCEGRRVGLRFCGQFQEELNDARDELLAIESEDPSADGSKGEDIMHKLKAVDLLKRFDEGNIFGSVNQNVQNFSVVRDTFLAHLGSVLSSSMKHVVTPSTADGAFHYYETVYFQVYFITEVVVKDDRLLPVDRQGLKAALSELILPSQRAIFNLHTLALSEDAALAMAFASAKRATIVPMLLANGTYKTADRVYLDSLILQHHIKQIYLDTEKKPSGRPTIEVPIFWFLRSSGVPLLVDKHYVAKALPDMVFVVQSANHAWESHIQCNGESILWDLRQPSKAAMAAVAEHMAGLLPSHVTFSQVHENAIQDWLWSVGSHPFSSTSAGWHMLQFHRDAMARSYIVTALDESIDILNSGVQLLANERTQANEQTQKATFSTFRAHEHSLRYGYNQVVTLWKQIAGFNEELKYSEALKLLSHLETTAQSFYSKANETISALHPVYCTQQHKLRIRKDVAAGISVTAILICLRLALRPRIGKPKIN